MRHLRYVGYLIVALIGLSFSVANAAPVFVAGAICPGECHSQAPPSIPDRATLALNVYSQPMVNYASRIPGRVYYIPRWAFVASVNKAIIMYQGGGPFQGLRRYSI